MCFSLSLLPLRRVRSIACEFNSWYGSMRYLRSDVCQNTMYRQLALLVYLRELQGVRHSKLDLETGFLTHDIRGFPHFLLTHVEVLA
jgi:hypothetical protein